MCQALVGPATIVKKSDMIQALVVFIIHPMTNLEQLLVTVVVSAEWVKFRM